MLTDAERDVIDARIEAILVECKHDYELAEREIRVEYRDRREHVEYALYELTRLRTSPSTEELPVSKGAVWKRILRDDAVKPG